MLKFVEENGELSTALLNLVRHYEQPTGRQQLLSWAKFAAEQPLLLAGVGTSAFANGSLAERLTQKGHLALSDDAGELLHRAEGLPLGLLPVLTSQSGESVEIRQLVERGLGEYVAVTNDQNSTLARDARIVLPLLAGPEETITTKTYTNTLALLRLMEAALDGLEATARLLDVLKQAADALTMVDEACLAHAADQLMSGRRLTHLAFVGRGDSLVSAQQCALTFSEGLKQLAQGFSGAAFRHGPFECVGPQVGLVVHIASERTAPLLYGLAQDAAERGSPVVVFDGSRQTHLSALCTVPVVRVDEEDTYGLYPILAARSHNLLLHLLAQRLGITTGTFRYGQKVTVKE